MFGTPSPNQAPPGAQLPSKAGEEIAVLGALAVALAAAFPTAVAAAGVLVLARGRLRRAGAVLAGLLAALWLVSVQPRRWAQHWLRTAEATVHALSSHHPVSWSRYLGAGAPAGLLVGALAVLVLGWVSARLRPGVTLETPRPSSLRSWVTLQRLGRHPVSHPDRSPLGVGPHGKLAEVSDVEANGHVLIVGATGAGKTVTTVALLTSAVARGRAVVLVDMKGGTRPAAILAAAAQRHHRPFHWVTLSGPTHYNPLARGDYSERMSTLIGSEVWTEPHYQRQAARQLQLVLQALDDPTVRPDDGVWLPDVVAALSPSGLRQLAGQVSSPSLGPALRAMATSARQDPAAMGGLAGRLGLLVESSAGRWMCRPPAVGAATFDLARAIDEHAVVVFSLDSAGHAETAAQFGSFVVQDLKAIAGLRLAQANQEPVYVAIDEFSALAGPQLTGLVTRGREAGICVVLATQELADLTSVSPAFCDQVLGDTNVKIIHRQDVADSAERLAATMGTDRSWDVSLSQASAAGLFAGRRNRNLTWYPVDRSTVEPSDLLRLPQGIAVLVAKQPRLRVERVQVVPSRLEPVELPTRQPILGSHLH